MTIKPESLDAAAAGGGTAVSVWNFVLGGDIVDLSDINTLLGVVLAFLSMVVLIQRFLINRRELKKKHGESPN
jgi:hypothetical protein